MALMMPGFKAEDIVTDTKNDWEIKAVPGKIGKYYIVSIKGEPLYRPANDVVCDKVKFGGEGKRLMALMMKGVRAEDIVTDTKSEWQIKPVAGKVGKYYIVSHKGEPLYRPADNVTCDGKRLMALMRLGVNIENLNDTKSEWEILPLPLGTPLKFPEPSPGHMAPQAEVITPFTPWDAIQPTHSFLEELAANSCLRAKLLNADAVKVDTEAKLAELAFDPEAQQLLQRLDPNEAAAVLAFTHDHRLGQDGNYFFEMNNALRKRGDVERTAMMQTWGFCVHYQLKGMSRLDDFQGHGIRGLPDRTSVIREYKFGRPIQWGAFTSVAVGEGKEEVAKHFSDKDSGILAKIGISCGKQLGLLSFFPNEGEVILSPASKFLVIKEPYQDVDGWWYVELMQEAGKPFIF